MQTVLAAIDRLNGVVQFLVGTLVALMLLDVSAGIFYRYIIGSALPWTEELARYLMVWAGFLAAGIALRQGLHVGFDFLVLKLPPAAARAAGLLSLIGTAVFVTVMTVQGVLLMHSVAVQQSPVLRVSMAWPYAAIPTSGLLMLLEVLVLLREALLGRLAKPSPVAVEGA